MADEWFYLENSKSIGPQSTDELIRLLHIGKITHDTPVWALGAEKWCPLSKAIPAIAETPPPLPHERKDTRLTATAVAETSIANAPTVSPILAPAVAQIGMRGAWLDTSPHPWRRYFARTFDGAANGLLSIFALSFGMALLGYPIPDEFSSLLDNRVVGSMAVLIAAIPLNALLIGYTGGTLGKWLFGVRIVRVDSTPIGFKVAFIRECLIWVRGLGLGIPIVMIFTCVSAFNTLKKERRTSWDKELSAKVVHRPGGAAQVFGILGGILAWAALLGVIGALANIK